MLVSAVQQSESVICIHTVSIMLYMSMLGSQFIHHPLPSWSSYVFSLYLCLYFCPANKIICTIFKIPCICINIRYLFFVSDLLQSVWHVLGPSVSFQITQCPFIFWQIISLPPLLCMCLSPTCLILTLVLLRSVWVAQSYIIQQSPISWKMPFSTIFFSGFFMN